VNLLREGLDLPEVALVAIMDADVESYLRDKRSLIQIIGRAARNTESRVIFYADKITKSMKGAMDETSRRRTLQEAYNTEHGINPRSVKREVTKSISKLQQAISDASKSKKSRKKIVAEMNLKQVQERLDELEILMADAAERLEFESAIALRQEWRLLKEQEQKLLTS
jgi:excinuclease ABC subunit B